MSSGRAARRRARELALQGVYQWLLSGNSVPGIVEHLQQSEEFAKADGELFTQLLRGTIGRSAELEADLTPFIHRTVEELSPVERAILLLGAFELKCSPEIPYRVIINEAIELAKGYGGTDGHRFVNGVLDKLAGHLRQTEIESQRTPDKP